MSERANFLLRLLYYPPAAPGADAGTLPAAAASGADAAAERTAEASSSKQDEWGISAHCDFELFTIMHQSAPGLEVLVVAVPRSASLPVERAMNTPASACTFQPLLCNCSVLGSRPKGGARALGGGLARGPARPG